MAKKIKAEQTDATASDTATATSTATEEQAASTATDIDHEADVNDAAPAPEPTNVPAQDPELALLDELAKIGDPYAMRQAVNQQIITARQELRDINEEYKRSIAKLEDEHAKADEDARVSATRKHQLEAELAKVRKLKKSEADAIAGNAEAAKVRAQVQQELAAAGIQG